MSTLFWAVFKEMRGLFTRYTVVRGYTKRRLCTKSARFERLFVQVTILHKKSSSSDILQPTFLQETYRYEFALGDT
jgi:hypothetical protein